MNGKPPEIWQKMKKPPAAFAGGGLDGARLLNPVCQAPLPARALEPLIRGSGIDAAMHRTGEKFALAPEVCIALLAVEQSDKGRVKRAGRG